MRKKNSTESQIVRTLKSVEAGRTIREVCRDHDISDATCYSWKSKYDGMEAPDIKRLKELEEESRHLRQMFMGQSLKNRALQDVMEKVLKPAERPTLIDYLLQAHGLSVLQASRRLLRSTIAGSSNITKSDLANRSETCRHGPIWRYRMTGRTLPDY